MPLKQTALASSLQNLFEGKPSYPADVPEAGRWWAASYRQYAADALAGPTAPAATALTAAQTRLASALANGFTAASNAGPAGAAVLAAAMDAAFVAFWLAPAVPFAPPLPAPPAFAGVVTVAPPGVLAGLLPAAFTAGLLEGAGAPSQANAIATALHAWTISVMVVNTPLTPPGPPLPPVPLH